jgi:hydrogenase maturation protease
VHLVRDPLPHADGGSRLTLVIGVGNEWRRDDAAGLVVARRLRERALPAVRVIEHEGEPLDLLEQWSGADAAIVIDAVNSRAEPGTIHRVDALAAKLPGELFRGSTHALGVAEAVELGRALERLPGRLLVLGIEAKRVDAGAGLSPEVERSVARLVDELAGCHSLLTAAACAAATRAIGTRKGEQLT